MLALVNSSYNYSRQRSEAGSRSEGYSMRLKHKDFEAKAKRLPEIAFIWLLASDI